MDRTRVNRRGFLALGLGAAAATLTACQQEPPTPQVVEKVVTQVVTQQVVVTATAAPAAAAAGTGKQPVTLELSTPFTATPGRRLHRDWMLWAIEQFGQEHPHIRIEHKPAPDYYEKLWVRIAAGSPPDIFAGAGGGEIFRNPEAWVNLKPFMDRDKFDLGIYYGLDDGILYRDGVYGLPFQEAPSLIYYNVDLLAKKKVDPPNDNWSWDDYLSAAQKLTGGGDFGIYHRPLYSTTWRHWVHSAGGEEIGEDRVSTRLGTPQALEALQWLIDLHTKHKVAPAVADTGLGTGDAPFITGKVGMFIRHTGWIPFATDQIKDFKWDVAKLPKHPKTGKRITFTAQSNFVVPSATKYREEAWLLTKLLGGEASNDFIGVNKIYTPCTKKAISDTKAYLAPPPAGITILPSIMANDLTRARYSKRYGEWSAEVEKQLITAFSGQRPLEEVVKGLIESGDKILKQA